LRDAAKTAQDGNRQCPSNPRGKQNCFGCSFKKEQKTLVSLKKNKQKDF
jgi:hypothetical protein